MGEVTEELGGSDDVVAITPDTPHGFVTRQITIGTAGVLRYRGRGGATKTTASLPAGSYPIKTDLVIASGTTATEITGFR